MFSADQCLVLKNIQIFRDLNWEIIIITHTTCIDTEKWYCIIHLDVPIRISLAMGTQKKKELGRWVFDKFLEVSYVASQLSSIKRKIYSNREG